MKRIILSLIFSLVAIWVYSQKLNATASPNPVSQGAMVRVVYSVSGGSVSSFQQPDFSGFVVAGTNQETYINNGTMSMNFVFQIVPSGKVGKYTIQAAKAQVNGKWVSSNPLTIEVVAGKVPPQQTQNNKQQNPSKNNTTPQQNKNVNSGGQDFFIRAEIDKTSPYVGEQLTLNYKIYTRVNINGLSFSKTPSNKGFWEQPYTEKLNGQQHYENINGQRYVVDVIRKVSLIPQQSGRLTIEPLEVECVIVQQTNASMSAEQMFERMMRDPFSMPSFPSYQQIKKKVSSNALIVNVKPLPTANQPAKFSGAVGNFTIKAEIDKTKIPANEAITLKITVSGTGNLQLVDAPKLDFPPDFETYDPKVTEHINTSESGTSGTKIFEYIVIPRNQGEFAIPANAFSFFDIRTGSYTSIPIPEYKISVSKGNGSAVVSGQKDIRFINSDVRYIKKNNLTLAPIGKYFYGSFLFWSLIALLLLIFGIFTIILRKRIALQSNTALLKNKKATKLAKKRLSLAEKHLQKNENDAFYIELSRALWGYMSDKFNISQAELSFENVQEVLSQTQLTSDTSNVAITLLNELEFARFAPNKGIAQLDNAYKQALELILKIEKELK